MTDNSDETLEKLHNAIQEACGELNAMHPDLMITDWVVLVGQQGFAEGSAVSAIPRNHQPVYVTLGLLEFGKMLNLTNDYGMEDGE